MQIEKNIKLAKLFDAYGAILSQSQKECMADYLFCDLGYSEIAENKNISRQAVKDSIEKAIAKLEELEEKLGLVERIESLTKELEKLTKKED